MISRLLLAALSAAAIALPAAVAPAHQGAAQRDWTQNVARTPEGGFRLGNPNAPVKVIEFLSLACPHCAAFSAESGTSLHRDYVRSGRVSIEYRNIIINAPDVAATILTRCAAPRAFFDMSHELLRTQSQWLGRAQALSEAQRTQLRSASSPMDMVQRLVPMIGLDQVAARHGLTPAAQRTCMSTQANFNQIETMVAAAHTQFGVTGTPTFVINGQVANTNVWAGIEPLLRPAG